MSESWVNLPSLNYLDDLFVQFQRDPQSVSPQWQDYFARLGPQLAKGDTLAEGKPASAAEVAARPTARLNAVRVLHPEATLAAAVNGAALEIAQLQDRVDQLVRGYRVRGHLAAKIDPLGFPRPRSPELEPESYGLTQEDLDRAFSTRTIKGVNVRTLGDIVTLLRNTYCRSIGAQFMHIDDLAVRDWLQRRMEGAENRLELSRSTQLRILTRLTDAVIFEEFVRARFVGAKTFSLEGGESLIPLLDLALEKAGEQGVKEVVLAMAHRGRLNVLANVLGKRAQNIFWSFDDPKPELSLGGGDVRYHLGHSSDWLTSTGKLVHISLCFNPSHLEFVSPVALGRVRAKQDAVKDLRRSQGMALIIHGDAAFAGEGVVQETLNLSQLPGYCVGGALHVVLNNQIGFTTSPEEGRSTTYATDVAKMLQSPIFHVNGEDPEAVAQVVNLALDFRHEFQRDVVIDMYCFRRLGHNEGDDPTYTHPRLYEAIQRRKTVREGYLDHLLQLGGVTRAEADHIAHRRRDELEREFDLAKKEEYQSDTQFLGGRWQGYFGGLEPTDDATHTGVPAPRLADLLDKLCVAPEGFHVHKKLQRLVEQRLEMARGERPLDWSAAEALALASLATEGHPVRLSGQDSERGTFSQRHAVWHDLVSGQTHTPLQHMAADQARVEIVNSPLSEVGVLGFDYGYSLDMPEALVAWEAQFGDFWNAAQVIVDQFIASAEYKWRRLSGLVMLLPHGFEGQGPEHSSARVERFLMLSARHNMQITCPTTPAQYFHLLRRQVKRKWRKPLVVLTPKSLLRHPRVVSSLEECAAPGFLPVIADAKIRPDRARRVLLCMGKIYYELMDGLERAGRDDVAVIRLEQAYPVPQAALEAALAPYAPGTPAFWVQEEPLNMGAAQFVKVHFGDMLLGKFPLRIIARPESATPATGSSNSHKLEQNDLIVKALAEE